MAAANSRPELQAATRLVRLTRRADFLAAARDVRRVSGGVTLELTRTPDATHVPGTCRVGFTASRKVGNAVCRNRAKRRLRALARALLPLSARPGHDYVLVARTPVLILDFQALLDDLAAAIATAHRKLDARTGGDS